MIFKPMEQLLFFLRQSMIWLIFELVESATLWKPLYKSQEIATAFGW